MERHWGVVFVFRDPGRIDMLKACLPEGHRIIATRELDDEVDEHIVEGPDMPVVQAGKDPERTDLMTQVMGDGTYGYWAHATYKRWRIQ
jgi:hypothetical protein